MLIMIFLAIWQLLSPERAPAAKVSYTDFLAFVEADHDKHPHAESVTIRDGDYIFTVKDPASGSTSKKLAQGPRKVDSELIDKLRKNKVAVSFEKEEASPMWSGALVTIVPMLLLLGMFYLFMRQLQVGGGKAMSFGKSRARMLNENANKITFEDVAGIDEAFGVGDGHAAPVRLVRPRRQVGQYLRFATTLLTPEQSAGECPLEARIGHPTHIFRPPVMIARLLVALQVHLVPNSLAMLQLAERA